jgi:hypothetical protein
MANDSWKLDEIWNAMRDAICERYLVSDRHADDILENFIDLQTWCGTLAEMMQSFHEISLEDVQKFVPEAEDELELDDLEDSEWSKNYED